MRAAGERGRRSIAELGERLQRLRFVRTLLPAIERLLHPRARLFTANPDTELTQNHSGRKAAVKLRVREVRRLSASLSLRLRA